MYPILKAEKLADKIYLMEGKGAESCKELSAWRIRDRKDRRGRREDPADDL